MGAVASPDIVGRYAIYGKIASGGMASVHFARLLGGAGFSRTVAVKRLHPHLAEDPEFLATMIDEARMAARIHHPNVVPTLDVVSVDGELLLVMEYVRGESLARLLRAEIARDRRVPLPVASAIVIGTLHGLHAAHEATSTHGDPLGIVHRDVSPQNILVGVDGVARVIDFGVAKAAGRLQTTGEGIIKGKIAYMAPEQLTAREVTRAADVYAMGVVLWEVLAGKRLFQGDGEVATVKLVLAGAMNAPSRHAPNLPAELDALIMRALAANPADRFVTALEMAEVLMRVVPPAFPTDVGRWCQEAAQESLARRGTLLAEIESSAGMPAPSVTGGDAGNAPVKASRSEGAHRRSSASPGADRTSNDDASTVASQASSLSIETSKPRVMLRAPSPRLAVATMACGCVLVVGAMATLVWGSRRAATPDPSSGAPSSQAAAASRPPTAPEAVPSASTEPKTAEVAAPPATAAATPPVTVAATAAETAPAAAPVRTAIAPASRPAGVAAHAPAKPKPGSNCNPTYFYDATGKHYKPECF